MARVENIDLRAVPGTGVGGRVTRDDVVRALETRQKGGAAAAGARHGRADRRLRGPAGPDAVVAAAGDARRPRRAHDPHARDHRAAHGVLEAHLAARLHRVRVRPDAHRGDPRDARRPRSRRRPAPS